MSGIYIHIPFCKKACHYCNFHFSTSLALKDEMVDAIVTEIHQRHHELTQKNLQSIYFGGGTPSLLNAQDLEKIFAALSKHFSWDDTAEITLEANPDDLTRDKLKTLKSVGINRLSIGIQSFSDEDLRYMNRAHNSIEATQCLEFALAEGFENLTIDLIYGSPKVSDETWQSHLKAIIDFGIPHISAYCLTVEENTALDHFIKTGKSQPLAPDAAIRQFDILMDTTAQHGYIHYEISNFAKAGKFAVHNTNYWKGQPYLGIGPAAHSFDGKNIRRWNIAHNPKYIKAVKEGTSFWESEILSEEERYNEYILTGLRTMWGIKEEHIKTHFSSQWNTVQPILERLTREQLLCEKDGSIVLTRNGKYMADNVSMQLFGSADL